MRRHAIQHFPLYVLILLLFSSPVLSQQEDIKAVHKRFIDHVRDVYVKNMKTHMTGRDMEVANLTMTLKARLFGYALGQQLKYIKKNTPNHRLWLNVEKEILNGIDEGAQKRGAELSSSPQEIEQLKKKLRTQFKASLLGWFNDQLVPLTGVLPGEAPNFFETLGQDREVDALAGIYDCRVEGWEPGVLEIRYTMELLTWEFKLISGGRLQWHWSGTLRWNSDAHGRRITLQGEGHNLQAQQTEPVRMGLVKGEDGRWRAGSFVLGNHWILTKRR